MNKSRITLLVILGTLVLLVSWIVGAYNGLVSLDEETRVYIQDKPADKINDGQQYSKIKKKI
jgi:homoaconitase/3-isopropylmalate dehydratase large subunit